MLYGHALAPDFGRLTFRAPWIELGAYTGDATGGTLFQLAYTLHRPATVTATLRLADGRQLTMTVGADALEVLLPPDMPTGAATVLIDLLDADGIDGHAELTVQLQGMPTPSGGPRPSAGVPRVLRAERTSTTRTIDSPAEPIRVAIGAGVVREQSTTRDTEVAIKLAFGRGTARPRRSPSSRARGEEIAIKLVAANGRLSGRRTITTGTPMTVSVGETAVVRRDGQEIEEALLLALL